MPNTARGEGGVASVNLSPVAVSPLASRCISSEVSLKFQANQLPHTTHICVTLRFQLNTNITTIRDYDAGCLQGGRSTMSPVGEDVLRVLGIAHPPLPRAHGKGHPFVPVDAASIHITVV